MRLAIKRLSGIALAMLLLATFNLGAFAEDSASLIRTLTPQKITDREDVLIEGFEGPWLPAGWAEINTFPNNWRRTNYLAHNGEYSATCSWSTAIQDEYLVTPALDFSAASNPKIEFYEDQTDWSTGFHHYIMVSTTSQTDPGAFSIVEDWTPGNHSIPGFDSEPTTVSLYEYAGESTVYVAFRYRGTSASSDTWYVDDVRVYLPGEHDVACTAVAPAGHVTGGTSVTPQATVENIGSTTESFNVQMEISQAGAPIYSEIASVSSLPPGNVTTVNFPAFTAAGGSYFDLTGTTLLVGDGNAANDMSSGTFDTYNNPHVPLGMLFTNSGCGPCVSANVALDSYMQSAGDAVALLRVHTWWPYPGDIMYTYNTEQASYLVNEYGVSGVPHFWVDSHYWDLEHTAANMVAALDEARTWWSPLNMDLTFDDATDMLSVTLHVNNDMLPGDYRLYCSITEDNINHNGGNGEPIHMQAFRRMFLDVDDGIPISTVPGDHVQVVHCAIDDGVWDYDELRASVYVRDENTGRAWQAASRFLNEIDDPTGTETPSTPFALGANYPNPFNPKTNISFSLDQAGPVSLSVFDLEGRLVKNLLADERSAGDHQVTWNGTDELGRSVASGVYFYRLESGMQSQMRKMLLLK